MIIDIKVPTLAESISEATLMSWYKQQGEAVSQGDNLIDIETDKVTLEVTAPENGVLKEIVKQDGAQVGSDEVIARLDTDAAGDAGTGKTKPEKPAGQKPDRAAEPSGKDEEQPAAEPRSARQAPKLGPAVRRLLDEHGLDAENIPASRDDGRIIKQDVLKYLESRDQPATDQKAPANTPKQSIRQAPAMDSDRPQERVPMTRLRRRTAERLLSAQQDNAILTTFNEINMAPVTALRNRYRDEFEKTHNVKLGFMSFFTRAAVEALKQFPVINAAVDNDDIVYHGYFDIGIAVSSDRGLVVPVIRDADQLSLAETETTIRDLGERARDSKLTMDDLTGGTFTITNGGIFGSLMSTPILNPPQSAILGMHKVQERPVAENGEVVIRPMMYVALSYDHRIIDGRDAVQFLVAIKNLIEDPGRLLLQV